MALQSTQVEQQYDPNSGAQGMQAVGAVIAILAIKDSANAASYLTRPANNVIAAGSIAAEAELTIVANFPPPYTIHKLVITCSVAGVYDLYYGATRIAIYGVSNDISLVVDFGLFGVVIGAAIQDLKLRNRTAGVSNLRVQAVY